MEALFIVKFVLIGVVLAVCLFFSYLIATEFEKVAKDKGYCDNKYFWFSFVLGIVGYLLVIALPDRGIAQDHDENEDRISYNDQSNDIALEELIKRIENRKEKENNN